MRKVSKRTLTLVVPLVLVLVITIGSSLAYLSVTSGPITNTFNPSSVTTVVTEERDGNVKKNVRIQNTGDIDAHIRAAIVVTWQNDAGDVLGQQPVAGTDYRIVIGSNWTKKDGFYNYKNVVAPGASTDPLIVECAQLKPAPVDGYYLCVEILGSGIQSVGITGTHPWGN